MTVARRTVEDPNGDITVNVDSVDLGAGAGDVPFVKLTGGATDATGRIGGGSIDDAITGVPILAGGRASTATPSAMSADGDIQVPWLTREGSTVVSFNRTRIIGLTPTIDTAVYADGDRLGSVVTVSGAALRNGGSGVIVGATLHDDAASNFTIEAIFHQVTPTLANADNGAFDYTDANHATAQPIDKISFLSANSTTFTSNRICSGTYNGGACAMYYTCASNDTALYMVLRARGAYDAVATDDLIVDLEVIRF